MEITNKQHHEKLDGVAEFVIGRGGKRIVVVGLEGKAKQTVGNERERPGRH